MDLLRSQTWQGNAVAVVHVLSPVLSLATLLVASIISLTRSETSSNTAKPKAAVSKRIAIILTVSIAVLFLGEAILLAHADPSLLLHTNADLVYALFSTLVWLILSLSLSDTNAEDITFHYLSSWVIYLASEIVIVLLAVSNSNLPRDAQFARKTLQGVRTALSLGLLALPLIAAIHQRHEKVSDEETAPLLIAFVENDETQLGTTSNGNDYGTTQLNAHVESPSSKNSSDNKKHDKNEEDEAGETHGGNKDEDEDEDEDEDRQNWGKLTNNWWVYAKAFTFFVPYIWPKSLGLQLSLAAQCLCVLVRRFTNVLLPLTLGSIINALSGLGHQAGVPWSLIIIYLLLSLLDSSAGMGLLEKSLWLPVEKNAQLQLSNAAYKQIMTLSCDFHDSKTSSMVWQTMTRGTEIAGLFHVFAFELSPVAVDLVVAITVFWWLFDLYMSFIVACVMFLYLWTSRKAIAIKTQKRREFIKSWETEFRQLADSSLNWTTVSYFNNLRYEIRRYASSVLKRQDITVLYSLIAALINAAESIIIQAGSFAGLCVVAYQIVYGGRKVGDFMVLLSYWQQLSSPLNWFAHGFQDIARMLIDAEKLLVLFQRKASVYDKENAQTFVLKKGEVEFKNVSFSYDGKRPVINDVSMHVEGGQTVALVGETGGGKSTILKLLFRFYDVTQGEILVDGQDVRDVTWESFHTEIGVVPQDPVLFNETILDNLKYAKLDASDEEVQAACRAASLHDKILSFTKGYQSKVGERGVKMSGGELQRMAIARAILRDPKILLLDEATSSVDSETEAQIQASLKSLRAGRTTFVIAHRLSTIVHADQVLVIKMGEVVELGTHKELLMAKGHYHKLWSRQLKVESGVSGPRSRSRSSIKGHAHVLQNDLSSGDDNSAAPKQTADGGHDEEADGTRPTHHDSAHAAEQQSDGLGPFVDTKSRKHRGRSPAKAIAGSMGRRIAQRQSPEKSQSQPNMSTVLKPDAPEFVPRYLEATASTTSVDGDAPKNDGVSIDGSLDSINTSKTASTTALATVPEEKNPKFWSRRKSTPVISKSTSQPPEDGAGKENADLAAGTKTRRRSKLNPRRKKTQSEPFADESSIQVDGAEEGQRSVSDANGKSRGTFDAKRRVSAPGDRKHLMRTLAEEGSDNDDGDSMDELDKDDDVRIASPSIKAPANTPARGASEDTK